MALFVQSSVQATNNLGNPVSGAKWKFFLTGTTTPATVYADADLSTPLGVEVTANSSGWFVPIYLDDAVTYRAKLTTSAGATIGSNDIDPVSNLLTALSGTGGADLIGVAGGGSVQDALDAMDAAPATSYIAGTGGDFATLINALDYFKTIPLLRPTTLTLTGTHTIPDTGYVFDHPNARNLYITGPAWTGGQRLPTNADMTGTKATDLATVAGLSSARLILAGTDTGGTNGYGNMTGTTSLDLPYGIGGISRLMVECHNRYGVSVGFSTSHSTAQGNVSARFSNCAFVGGVWPVIGKDAFLSFDTANWFGYYIDGGAFGVFGGYVDCDAGLLEIYCPPGDTAYNPKYGLYFEGGNFKINSNGLSGRVKMKGPILHGIYAVGGAGGECRTVSFDTVTQPITVGDASINVGTPVITNADPANSTLRTGSTQPGVPGNEGSSALVSVGPGGSIRMNGATITSSVAAYALFIQGGEYKGYGTIALSGSSTTNNTIRVTASKGNVAAVSVATSLGGSVNQVSALQNGDIFLYSASGVAYSPALNTPTNGSGIYN